MTDPTPRDRAKAAHPSAIFTTADLPRSMRADLRALPEIPASTDVGASTRPYRQSGRGSIVVSADTTAVTRPHSPRAGHGNLTILSLLAAGVALLAWATGGRR